MKEIRRSHDLSAQDKQLQTAAAASLRKAEELLRLDERLPAILKGESQPADADERLALAEMCLKYKGLPVSAFRFYARCFDEKPQLVDDLDAGYLYNAACAATLAGCSQGKDADQLDGKERARLRQQALGWLRSDLSAWGKLMERAPDKTRQVLSRTMRHWQKDMDFAGVRGEGLNKLPEAERHNWQRLWHDVEILHQRAAEPAKKAGS